MRSVCPCPLTPPEALFRTSEYPNLPILAKVTNKTEFYNLGTGSHPAHPVNSDGKPAAHIGTGAYALDLLCTNDTAVLG
ncbi:hypothetical protein J7E87_29260 [Streptomyces sp. ISL-1]|uniref:hypothetical protein n=1 Tax=Streptomyces sp. ISL-1 TaxID=2817657 RepID=UPI001BE9B96C|nr:hypothetical protein [Streptomyces sp. ISL-1]MBT2393397.1 hypothetical protein [Streptomyces sp. ISL-1]